MIGVRHLTCAPASVSTDVYKVRKKQRCGVSTSNNGDYVKSRKGYHNATKSRKNHAVRLGSELEAAVWSDSLEFFCRFICRRLRVNIRSRNSL